jgi:hypothetical protein
MGESASLVWLTLPVLGLFFLTLFEANRYRKIIWAIALKNHLRATGSRVPRAFLVVVALSLVNIAALKMQSRQNDGTPVQSGDVIQLMRGDVPVRRLSREEYLLYQADDLKVSAANWLMLTLGSFALTQTLRSRVREVSTER